LGLDNTAASDDQVEIDRRVNAGVTDVLLRTSCKVTSATMTETDGSGDYTLDAAIMDVKEWKFANASLSVVPERVSVEEILRRRAWTTSSASPASAYALAGSNLLMVWPTPSADDTITVYYVPRPVLLTADSDTPSEIPEEFHPTVEQYALWKLGSMTDDSSSGNGETYRIQYEGRDGRGGEIARIRRHVVQKGGRLGRAQLHPSRRNRWALTAKNDQR
jgi:hypothetical protein